MDVPTPVDLDSWPRRGHFEHYLHAVPCSYSITVEVDVTELVAAVRSAGRRTYITQIWALASVIDHRAEFRLTVDDDGTPSVWPVLHPSFTVFNPDLETFSSLWVPFERDYDSFHEAASRTIAAHAGSADLFPQGPPPPNTFDVSSLPWTSFTGFNLNIADAWRHLAPIFTLGRYVERDGRTLLPLAVQIHHAAADGFHTARLIDDLRRLVADPSWATGAESSVPGDDLRF